MHENFGMVAGRKYRFPKKCSVQNQIPFWFQLPVRIRLSTLNIKKSKNISHLSDAHFEDLFTSKSSVILSLSVEKLTDEMQCRRSHFSFHLIADFGRNRGLG